MNPIIFLTPVALLILSVVLSVILVKKGVKVKRALAVHFLSLIVIVALSLVLPMAASAASEPDGAPAASDTVAPAADANDGMKYIAPPCRGPGGIGRRYRRRRGILRRHRRHRRGSQELW